MRQSNSGDLSPTGSTLTGEKQSKPGDLLAGLEPPRLTQGARVDGSNKKVLRRENKSKRRRRQMAQEKQSYWQKYEGVTKETIELAT
jgi:hypothetical protein